MIDTQYHTLNIPLLVTNQFILHPCSAQACGYLGTILFRLIDGDRFPGEIDDLA